LPAVDPKKELLRKKEEEDIIRPDLYMEINKQQCITKQQNLPAL
jgi:hypothetical protein